MVEAPRRTAVGLALAAAFIVLGHGFTKFKRSLNQCFGIQEEPILQGCQINFSPHPGHFDRNVRQGKGKHQKD